MGARTTRHRRYSDSCGGELSVFVTPSDEVDHHGKSAVYIGITRPDGLVWAPDEPMWLSPLYDANSRQGRREAADAAVGFFEASGCGAADNPAPRRSVGDLVADVRSGQALIAELHSELWAADSKAANDLHAAYRVARPNRRDEVSAFVDAYVEALNARAPEGLYFGTPAGSLSELGWWPLQR
jgi:hypothetical protein